MSFRPEEKPGRKVGYVRRRDRPLEQAMESFEQAAVPLNEIFVAVVQGQEKKA